MESTDESPRDVAAEPQALQPEAPEEGDGENSAPKKPAVRKRTKTGCLTCRKRRIKCDEGRPTCNNCLKSKRVCEGYNQRVIFKSPIGFPNSPFGPLPFPAPSPQALVREQLSAAQKSSSQSLPIIAPKPPSEGYHQLSGAHFNNAYPDQAGQMASVAMNFDPNGFGSQNAPSKYTFFPPTTVDAFSQHQWRQGQPENFGQFPPIAHENLIQNISPVPSLPQQQQQQQQQEYEQPIYPQLDKGKSRAEPEEPIEVVASGPEEWEYPVSDDESMAESDDMPISEQQVSLDLNKLGVVGSRRVEQPYDMSGTQTRTFAAFASDDLLATYEPSPNNSPLNDRKTAAVFWHFVHVTGPSISLYERHPVDTTPFLQEQPMPQSRQHIWTHTFPILAFTHPALLQAILAIASLQISKLQMVPPTASLKHYHLALRRIARNVSRPNRRAQPANLAATLVLSFYEVWNSDHDKWSRHLLGARLIIKEIPYAEMTRNMMRFKLRERSQEPPVDVFGMFTTYDNGPLHNDWDLINVPLLSAITGREISYDELGMLPEEHSAYRTSRNTYTEKDKERYQQLSDLFWWYCKMDVYQSILGGTRLFLEYNAWTQCPPRAPMGRLDAIFGTYDHLVLLLGRVANFTSKDLTRKRETFKPNGPGRGGSPGMFPGMVPRHPERVTVPMGFTPPRETSPPSDAAENVDFDTRTAEAYREWEEIKKAFETFKDHFGPEFEQLGADIYPAKPTPFGFPALYRTYSIAGIWMNYYMGLIVLHRAHPTMPPVAMVAAGISARETAPYCMEVGRIAAGLEENIEKLDNVSTLMAAALIECCFPLFVAGIQYRDDNQRQWLIRRLHDIARLTGWQSARQIAVGCESAWTKAWQLGRGPEYKRAFDLNIDPPGSVWVNARRIDKRIQEIDGSDDATKIVLAKGEKASYAMGLLAVEHDLERLDLDTSERDRR
ncbi:uncharacterized protein F4822DRAFT_310470 [Hypoxylon trugodes]|uniref:uncharacterized protein n=1 Tax=Hypoxylon trugodes TaxID=326681 RepID=UPI00219DDF70|nr:uncharacterized protein F4822DRAFT_310470 [Hypoxylon trugodes]KAI1386255.1 hypothetical protein F4822DRAFT_310470 [Hypoxylon trugodes]